MAVEGDLGPVDLLIHNATLPDGSTHMSVAVHEGRIVEVAPGLQAAAHAVVDAAGLLLSPPFVDPHFHMDATLSYGLPRVNQSGTLLEGIALWGELKPLLTAEALVERALAYCDWAVAKGLLAIRTHVDTSDASLLAVDALLEVKRRFSYLIASILTLVIIVVTVVNISGSIARDEDRRQGTPAGVDVPIAEDRCGAGTHGESLQPGISPPGRMSAVLAKPARTPMRISASARNRPVSQRGRGRLLRVGGCGPDVSDNS